jgi:hypothetical protein
MKTTLCLMGLATVITACSGPHRPAPLPAPAALVPRQSLPDPLVMLSGTPVHTQKEWENQRRPELARLFQYYMYGEIPPAPKQFNSRVLAEYRDFLGGRATLKLVRLECGLESNAPQIDLMVVLPNHVVKAPVFLAMNFCGNHAVTPDPRVPLARGWVYSDCAGSKDHRATEACRGTQAGDWPLDLLVERGFGFAGFYSGDIDSDRSDVSDGIYAWLARNDATQNNPTNRGSIAAWAWGFQRGVDYLVTDSGVDVARIAAVGHSRNGKTALLAGALDPRIALIIANQSGCGGAAPSRGKVGESVKAINDRFPHWFNGEFKEFNDATEKIPFDQHCLIALCAPRPVLLATAAEDTWANPAGQFEMLVAADPVYRLYGVKGVGTRQMPSIGQLTGDRLAYHIRDGKHAMSAPDWRVFVDFAARQWGAK